MSRERVDLLLVNPGNRVEQFAGLAPLATVAPPLGVALLAAYVRERGVKVAIFDAEAHGMTPGEAVEAITAAYDPKVVGLTAFTTKMTSAGAILRGVKVAMPGVVAVIGGHHASAIPERTLREEAADHVVKGEGFRPIAELMAAVLDGRKPEGIRGLWSRGPRGEVLDGGHAQACEDLDALPMAAWDLLPMRRYRAHHWQTWGRGLDTRRFAVINTSLGCPFDCDYCSVNVVYERHKVRYRSPAKVAAEIEHLVREHGVEHLEIIDDTFTVNRRHVEAVCEEIVKRRLGARINAWCFSRVDRADPRFLATMKAAGINWVFMGLESGNDTVLLGVNKQQTVDGIREATKAVRRAGINVGGNFVFGLPEDTEASMRQTRDLALEIMPEYANFFIMMAYPGARLRDGVGAADLPERWAQYGFFAPDAKPLRNARLTAAQIIRFRDETFQEFFGADRYQAMIAERFGRETLAFLHEQVLARKIERETV